MFHSPNFPLETFSTKMTFVFVLITTVVNFVAGDHVPFASRIVYKLFIASWAFFTLMTINRLIFFALMTVNKLIYYALMTINRLIFVSIAILR